MSEHGTLGLGSPWTRALFSGGRRDEVEALIPAGYRIDVTAVDGRPGPWRVRVVRLTQERDADPTEVIGWTLTRDPQGLVRAFAERLAAWEDAGLATATRAPRTSWCWHCRRAVLHTDDDARLVLVDGRDEWVCGPCWSKADVGPDVPLTYEEQEGME